MPVEAETIAEQGHDEAGDNDTPDVLVTGCGPIGLFTIAAARALGAGRIVASDIAPDRIALAKRAGADATALVPDIDVRAVVQDLTGGIGVSATIETSGPPAAIYDALAATTPGGRVIILTGLPQQEITLDLTGQVVIREVSISGLYGRLIDETWLQVERLLSSGRLDPAPLMTHSFRLDDFQMAFATARSGQAGKVTFELP